MCFLEVVVESLRLLPMRMPPTNLVFALVHSGVGEAGIGGGWRLFVGTDAVCWAGTSGRCVVGAVTIDWAGSTVSMVVGIGVLRLVCRRWTRDAARSVLGAVGLPEDVMLPFTLCGAGLATL